MRKIANTTELQTELERILNYAGTQRPSRVRLAMELRALSERVVAAATPRKTIKVKSRKYEDYDDSLTAAADDYASRHPEAEDIDLNPRWEDDDDRSVILLDVPR